MRCHSRRNRRAEAEERRQAEENERFVREQREREEAERQARQRAVRDLEDWAAAALADPDLVVLDTETTGLGDEACIVEIAVVSSSGQVLLDSLVNPGPDGERISPSAAALHGITSERVASAPTFSELLVPLTQLLDGRRCLIYNASFDRGWLRWELFRHYRAAGHDDPAASAAAWLDAMRFEDVMMPYSEWVGEWHDYHGGYTWQPLGGGHRAAGDCQAVLDCLRVMGEREVAAPCPS